MAVNQQFASAGAASIAMATKQRSCLLLVADRAVFTHEIVEDGHLFALTRDPIDVHSLKKTVLAGTDGAIVDFEGVVRNNTKGRATRFLDYECYEGMAVKMMAQIGRKSPPRTQSAESPWFIASVE